MAAVKLSNVEYRIRADYADDGMSIKGKCDIYLMLDGIFLYTPFREYILKLPYSESTMSGSTLTMRVGCAEVCLSDGAAIKALGHILNQNN